MFNSSHIDLFASIRCAGIYKIVNSKTGEFYVGSTKSFKRRWHSHLKLLREKKHHCKSLQESWNNHKESVFVFSILEVVSTSVLAEKEQYYIDTLLPTFNTARKVARRNGITRRSKSKGVKL